MKVIGITGGIGSGKSAVSGILSGLGAAAVDADDIARQVVAQGKPALREITDTFGLCILDANGVLNRKALSDIVFSDRRQLDVLNAITHKYIAVGIGARLSEIEAAGNTGIAVLEATIPVKCGFLDICDEVWAVLSEHGARMARVMERSGMTAGEIASRIDSQYSDSEYEAVSDIVIRNDGSLDELKAKVAGLYDAFVSRHANTE